MTHGREATVRAKILRQLKILTMLPVAPQRLGTKRIVDQLTAAGFSVNTRMVQRDLAELSRVFPLSSDDGMPAGWSWPRDSQTARKFDENFRMLGYTRDPC